MDKKYAYGFFAFLLALHLFYFLSGLQFGNIYTEDSPEYLELGENIFDRGTVYSWYWEEPHQLKYYSLRPPGYGLFVGLIQQVSESDYAILLVQNILSILTWLALAGLLGRFGLGPVRYLAIGLGLLLFPTNLILTNMVMADLLFQSTLFGAFYFLLGYLRKGKLRHLVWYNLLLAVGLLIKPVLLYFWVFNIPFSLYLFLKDRRRLILVLPALLLLTGGAWSLRNQLVTGWYHYSSIKTINLCWFNARQLLRTTEGWAHSDSVTYALREQALQARDFQARNEFLLGECTAIIMDDLPAYAYIHARGMAGFMLDPGRHDLVNYFPLEKEKISFFNQLDARGLPGVWDYLQRVSLPALVISLLAFLWNLLVLLSWLSFCLYRRHDLRLRLAVFLLVGYVCLLSVTIGYSRFKVGVYPVLLFTVPFFLQRLWQWWWERKGRGPALQE